MTRLFSPEGNRPAHSAGVDAPSKGPRPGFFEASLKPTDPLHIARNGYTLDTRRGLRGRTLSEVLVRAEAHWRQNYPRS